MRVGMNRFRIRFAETALRSAPGRRILASASGEYPQEVDPVAYP